MTAGVPPGHDLSQLRLGWPPRSLLSRLTDDTLDALVHAGRIQRFAAKEVLIEEGGTDTSAFLILSGCVKVTSSPDGANALLAVRVGGDVVGELAAVDGSPRSATVSGCGRTPAITVRISGAKFTEILGRDPDAMVALSTSITAKLRAATRRRIDLSRPKPIRLARLIVELVEDYGQRLSNRGHVIAVDLTQLELGTLIGTTETTAQRALRSLREEKLVDTGGQRLVVTDLDRLRRYADS